MFGRKKPPKEPTPTEVPKHRRGQALMAQLGLSADDVGSMEDMIYGDDDDGDLEAELAALQSDSSPEKTKPKPKSKAIDLAAIEKFAARDVDDDADDDISEGEESDLLAELDDLTDTTDDNDDKQSVKSIGDLGMMVEDRLAMYQIAVQNANATGDSGKERRLAREIQTLEDMLKTTRSGRPINPEDLPPPVNLTTTLPRDKPAAPQAPPSYQSSQQMAQKTTHNTSHNSIHGPPVSRPAPAKPIPAVPSSKPQISLSKTTSKDPNYVPGCEFVEEKDKETHAMLFKRRSQYKLAALAAKREGNMALATAHVRTAKQFDSVILALEEGKPIDLAKMPPPPSSDPPLKSLGTAATAAVTNEVTSRVVSEVNQGATASQPVTQPGTQPVNDQDDQALFDAPNAPSSIHEALTQRLNKYKSAEDDAKKEGNGGKARRMARIVKQYTECIRDHQQGKPIDLEGLPTPPGFGPIPMEPQKPYATLPAKLKPQAPVAVVTPQPTSSPHGVAVTTSPRPPVANPQKPAVSPQSQLTQHSRTLPSTKKNTSMRQDHQLTFLRTRMREFKEAAVEAKKNDDIELAKKYIRYAKGCEPMIQAAEAGLPVDLSQVPEAPSTDEDDKFLIVESNCDMTGDRDEMYTKLEESLTQQIQTCVKNALLYTKLGDIPMASKFKKFEQNSRKDLDSLKSGSIHGDPVPRFHYETRTFSMIKCNTDLGDNDLELSVLRGQQYNPPSGYTPQDMSTYVKYELPFPTEESQTGSTETCKHTCDPEYNEIFKLQINRKSRALLRVVERKNFKLEIFYKRGFMKSDKCLGTVNVPLLPLETVSTVHESYDLVEGKKSIGGKLEVKMRIRDPLKVKQVEEVKEKWLVIDTFLKTQDRHTSSVTSIPQAKKAKSDGTTSIEVMKFEKQQLDRQISFLKDSLAPPQIQALSQRSKLIQEKMENQQKSLKEGGIPALKAYAAKVECELQPYEDEAKALAKQGDMQKAQTLLTKKKEALKELNAIRARLKVMS